MKEIKAIEWLGRKVKLIDQTKLPLEESYVVTGDFRVLGEAIRGLKIRGAPSIGLAGAYGLALAASGSSAKTTPALLDELEQARNTLAETRPTAVNLFWALDRVMAKARENATSSVDDLRRLVTAEAVEIDRENAEMNRRMGQLGQELISEGDTVMTYCNAGPLATGEYGTALGVVRAAHEVGKKITVYACETRPFLQGARLTTWELKQLGVPCVLIVDGAAGFFMAQGKVNKVILGADRIAANGDTANKVGSYNLAVLAREHAVPFYVVAPTSTLDLSIETGREIPIEERSAEEVTVFMGRRIAPEGVRVANPSFDVTPGEMVSAIVTERGIAYPPFEESLARWQP